MVGGVVGLKYVYRTLLSIEYLVNKHVEPLSLLKLERIGGH